MTETSVNLIRTDFLSFVRKAYRHDHDGNKLGREKYIDYLCHELDLVAEGETKRLVINLPPRHLKTFLAAIYLPAWLLAHNPSAKIMIITYSDQLAADITYKIRRVLQSEWFKKHFTTRVAKNRAKVDDFATVQGGGVFATSVGGSLAGRGADLIVFDDPLDLKDAGNVHQIELVNQRFDSLILSRLNDPKTGRVIIIAHRLNENDLSAHVVEQGGWRRAVLPLVATRRKSYDVGYDTWHRKPGESLRSSTFSKKEIRRLQATCINPDFNLFYQQGVGASTLMKVKPEHFKTADFRTPPNSAVILSIDPAQRAGARSSYCVIQAWAPLNDGHLLLDQWREQCAYETLKQAYWRFYRTFSPTVVLIEGTSNGPALLAEARRKSRVCQIEEIMPDGRSKSERLLVHVPLIRRGLIQLPAAAAWRGEYIKEMVEFPSAASDDQVDATSQYLDWITAHPTPGLPSKRALGQAAGSDGRPISPCGSFVTHASRGGVLTRGRR